MRIEFVVSLFCVFQTRKYTYTNSELAVGKWRLLCENRWPPFPSIFCHCLLGCLEYHGAISAKTFSTIFLPIWLLSALYIMVKGERPCTTPYLFKAHLPTAHSPGSTRTSTRIQLSLPWLVVGEWRETRGTQSRPSDPLNWYLDFCVS